MPFKSEAQRREMFANQPEVAKRWAAEYPNQGKLPDRARKRSRAQLPLVGPVSGQPASRPGDRDLRKRATSLVLGR